MRLHWITFGVGLTLGLLAMPLTLFGLGIADGNSSDWMAFVGTLVGSALTVAGAFLLVQWQLHSSGRRHRSLLTALLRRLIGFVERVERPSPGDPKQTRAFHRRAAFELVKRTMAMLKDARQWATPHDTLMLDAYHVIENIDDNLEYLPDVIDRAETDPDCERLLIQQCKWYRESANLALQLLAGKADARPEDLQQIKPSA